MIGTVVAGRYRVLSRIGAGGAGEVYEAEDLQLPRKVALKFLASTWNDDPRLRERFLREAEALSSLDHPHICTIHQAGETDGGQLFIAMARYDGETLRTRLAQGRMGTTESLAVAAAVADGMDKAHRLGFLHRDLKPGNVILTADGVVKVLDFGLAKLPERTQVTETGTTMGTLAYVSPEQARGEELDARSDIYSLGVMLYEMLSGSCPFRAPNAAATLARVLQGRPRPLRELRPDLPAGVLHLVDRCTDAVSARRPASMTEVRDRILDALVELSPGDAARLRIEHVEATRPERAVRTRRRPAAVIASALVLAILVVARWDTVSSVLGIGGPPANRGVAILPLEGEGGGEDRALLAAGVGTWLTTQLGALTQSDPSVWVLPEWEARESTVASPPRRFGVDTWIDGSASAVDTSGVRLLLRIHDVRTDGARAEGEWVLGAGGEGGPVEWIAGVLGIDYDESALAGLVAACTPSAPALRPFLAGAGALRLERAPEALPPLEAALRTDPDCGLAALLHAEALLATASDDSLELRRVDREARAAALPPLLEPRRAALRAKVCEAADDREAADVHWRTATEGAPYDCELSWGRAGNLIRAGAFDASRRELDEGIAANPGYPGGYRALGFLLWREGEYREAVARFERAAELTPDDWMLYNYLGACWYALEEWDSATRMFRRSFDLHHNHQAVANLGTLYYSARDYESALEMFEWARDYQPDSYRVVGNIGSALQWIEGREEEARARFAEAAAMAEDARRRAPRDPRLLSSLAGYYSMDDTVRAVELAEEALRLAPDDTEVLFAVAVVHEQAGQRARALTLLGRALDHGLSLRLVRQEKHLDALREDPRFRLLVPGS